jgi:hypothetical protein
MIPHDPFHQLRALDRTSPQFRDQLRNFFHGSAYQNLVPDLESEDLAWLVEYLDSVSCHRSVRLCASLRTFVGSRRYFEPCNPGIPGILARTWEVMRRQGSATEIIDTFRVASGMCLRGYFQWLEGTHQTCQDIPWARPTEG